MKFSATAAVLAIALGASAHPSHHAHRLLHRSKGAPTFYKSANGNTGVGSGDVGVINDKVQAPAPDSPPAPSYSAPEVPPPANTPETKPAPSPKYAPPSSSSKPSGSKDNGEGDIGKFCGGDGRKRATAAQIASAGNTGGANYGCNLQPVPERDARNLPHTIKLNNVDSKDVDCACFLKVGKDGGVNGSFKDNVNFKVTIGGNKHQYVAVAPGTIGACSCGYKLDYNPVGQCANTWLEFDFLSMDNSKNGQYWSGADASSITASNAGTDIIGMKVYLDGKDVKPSVICPGGGGENAYFSKADEAKDGVGLNVPTSATEKLSLVADIGHVCKA